MKPQDLKITDWQNWLDKFKAANPNAKQYAAIRIENTPFTTARYFGGMTFNGDQYTYFDAEDESDNVFCSQDCLCEALSVMEFSVLPSGGEGGAE